MQYCEVLLLLLDLYLIFFVLLNILFSCLDFLHHKNIEKQYLVIISSYRARPSETQVDLRDQPIVVSEVGS